jgi:hypothetical protein
MYIPVTEHDEIIAVVPLAHETIIGIRFMTRQDGEIVHVETTALRNKQRAYLPEANYSQIKGWEGESMGTFAGKEGDEFVLRDLPKFALSIVAFRIIPARTSPLPDKDARFCAAGSVIGAPNPGICMMLGGRGLCCRAGGTKGLALLFRRDGLR